MKYLSIIIIFIVVSSNMTAHHPKLEGFSIGARPVFSNHYPEYGTDLNLVFFVVNAGVSLDYNIQKDKVNTSLFFGIGMFNALQIQYGFNSQDKYIRLRFEPSVFQNSGLWWYDFDEKFERRINILVNIDFNLIEFKSSRLGIGASLLVL